MAADYPAPKQGDWIAKDFRFHTGEVMPEVRLHYITVGAPTGEPVLVLHGTGSSADSFLTLAFAGELFGAGQPLDATKYFIILPDAIGAGKSTKPSDGLRAKFPLYNYDDMVSAQHRLITEGLGIKHLRLVIGNSMGGMQTWMWAEALSGPDGRAGADGIAADRDVEPQLDDAARMIDRRGAQRSGLADGNYTTQPKAFRTANAFFRVATRASSLAYQKMALTREKADKLLNDTLAAPFDADANDSLYQWDLSRDYDARSRPRQDPGHSARSDQLCRRRAQYAGDRADDGSAEAGEERQALSDPRERRHARPRHDGDGEILQAAAPGAASDSAEARRCGGVRAQRVYQAAPINSSVNTSG